MGRSTLLRASLWQLEMHDHFAAHVEAEAAMLERYESLADSSDSKAIRYLIDLISDDESRHHRVFEELHNAVEAEAESSAVEPRVPSLDRESHPDELLELTRVFLRIERTDAKELKRLRRRMRRLRGRSPWPLVVELMELDTAKHIHILRFVRETLSRQR
jgi:hypothetical protein